MKTIEEARIIARSSDPDWLGEEIFRLQEYAVRARGRARVMTALEVALDALNIALREWTPMSAGAQADIAAARAAVRQVMLKMEDQ